MLNKIIISLSISLVGSITVGLIFASCVNGKFDLSTLNLPGVIQVALLTSAIVGVAITPLTMWAYKPEKALYFLILWAIIVLYVIGGTYGKFLWLYIPVIIGVIGLIGIKFIK